MKKIFTLITFLILNTLNLNYAQPWGYDFGTSTGVYTEQGESESFLNPAWPGGGTPIVAIGMTGGSFNLENPGIINFGTDSELRCVASSGSGSGNVNKFAIRNYTPGPLSTIKFSIRFVGGESGTWYFFNGRHTSTSITFSGSTSASGSEVFSGLRWDFSPGGTITTYYRDSIVWTPLPGNPFAQNENYIVEIYSNNSSEIQTYTYVNQYSVAPGKWDLFVDSVLVGDDLPNALIASGLPINAFTFHGENSPDNTATIYLDDIRYTNEIAGTPLAVKNEISVLSDYKLYQNYPNPFNPETNISFYLPEEANVRLSVFNILGEKIRVLLDKELKPGLHKVKFNGDNFSSGIYFYKLETDKGISLFHKMTLIK